MIRPKHLQPGDRVAVLGGSSPTSKTSEELTQAVRDMGLEPVLYPSATSRYGFLSGTDEIRAADINAAFADESIKGIICTRGGYGFNRILPLLDWETIKKNPKLFGGYSDVTAMLNALNQICDLESYHMQMVGAWSDGLDAYTAPFVKSILFGDPVEFVNPEGSPITTIVPGKAEGPLCGGNLSLLAASMGTPYEIDTKGKILFIEEIGERPYKVDGMLTTLRNGGKFDDCAGVILGAFTDCGDREGTIGGLSLETIYRELIAPAGKPTISGVVCGHCSPSMSLPMGRLFKMDADAGTFGPVEK